MENEENQNQVSLRFPPPLEIAPRFPQSHNPDDDSPLPKTQNQKNQTKRSPSDSKSPNPRLQAHPSMRKCCYKCAETPVFGGFSHFGAQNLLLAGAVLLNRRTALRRSSAVALQYGGSSVDRPAENQSGSRISSDILLYRRLDSTATPKSLLRPSARHLFFGGTPIGATANRTDSHEGERQSLARTVRQR